VPTLWLGFIGEVAATYFVVPRRGVGPAPVEEVWKFPVDVFRYMRSSQKTQPPLQCGGWVQ